MDKTPAILGIFLSLVASLASQESAADTKDRALSKTRQNLEQRPTHAAVFDHYFKLLVESNLVETEIQALDARLKKEPGDATASIIQGRLLLRAGKEDKALEVLDAIGAKTPEIQSVLGEIYQKLTRYDQAARAFQAALPSATTSEQKRVLYEKIGKAQLSLGRKDLAIATWQQIGELDGGKFHRRLNVAELLRDAGLLAEAEKAYQPLLLETENDPAQQCRVMRDQGRLKELQGNLQDALTTYDAILQNDGL